MTENLLEASLAEPAGSQGGSSAAPAAGSMPGRPSGLPGKFWDDARGEVRLDALVKSYLELERRLGAGALRSAPPNPDAYTIKPQHDLLGPDPNINQRLHAAGFTQEQAQLVYDLAAERLMPLVAELAALFEADNQVARLIEHFGGDERWREIARQIDVWGRSRLPERMFNVLSTTYEGVLVMHRMMGGEEPGLLRDGAANELPASEAELKQLMRDPRYWRQQDPTVVDKVRKGFRRLYDPQR